jgi:hypothetical protein
MMINAEDKFEGKVDDVLHGNIIPDLNREWLCFKVNKEDDPQQRMLYEALLVGYDNGELAMQFNPWSGEMEYSSPDVN